MSRETETDQQKDQDAVQPEDAVVNETEAGSEEASIQPSSRRIGMVQMKGLTLKDEHRCGWVSV